MKKAFITLYFKKNNTIFNKKYKLIGIQLNNGVSDLHFINLENRKMVLEDPYLNSKKIQFIHHFVGEEISDNICLNVLEWLNKINGTYVCKVEFTIRFLNILGIKKSYYLDKNISESKLFLMLF